MKGMKECCGNCRYFHRLKHNISADGFAESTCCTLWTEVEPKSESSWVQEVNAESMCEMFTEKKE